MTRLRTADVSRGRREPPAEPVQSAQNGALKRDRNARHKGLGLVRSRGGQTHGVAPSLGATRRHSTLGHLAPAQLETMDMIDINNDNG